MELTAAFIHEPDRDNPGWHTWHLDDDSRFNNAALGRLLLRREGEHQARLRLPQTRAQHSNVHGKIHGGVTLALVDVGIFTTIYTLIGPHMSGSVTLDVNCQFVGAGLVGQPLDFVGEVTKETGRLVFVRGTVEQEHGLVASMIGTLRKPSAR
ncbi:PaaI family thioesterase [Novosphingobium sp. 9U]|uniref:PaaI family thioesterase n=1 Tax=Novosphingobium sp. 9U TaxID=2653158 RepID=UPI0012EF4A01|nr:PaaI family thioesterase [Novosphingobium sp. 9U]VWX46459.1 Phenylacetic acid degradation protein PaaD, thioesterase [Novosphingobium sp. 9U]